MTFVRNTVTSGIEMTEALLYYLIVINIVTFLVYGIDKWKSKQGSWRISEATLLILAVIGGSIGALLGKKRYHFVQSLWGMLIGLIPCLIGAGIYAYIVY